MPDEASNFPKFTELRRIQDDAEKIKAKHEELMLRKLLVEVKEMERAEENRKKEEESRERRRNQILEDIEYSRKKLKQKQEACTHRKGGKNFEGLTFGNDNNYSIIKHVYPNGKMMVMCSRCLKQWGPGNMNYDKVVQWPTDNETSSSVTFNIPHKPGAKVAEVVED